MENDIYLLAEEESDDLSMLEGIESTMFYSLSQSHKLVNPLSISSYS